MSSSLIRIAKTSYFYSLGEKLNDLMIGPKKYWSILNKFMNRRKISSIPPIKNGAVFVTDISEKASLFNDFFSDQCKLINTPSSLPEFKYCTNHRLESITFLPEDVLNLILNLNSNHSHKKQIVWKHRPIGPLFYASTQVFFRNNVTYIQTPL